MSNDPRMKINALAERLRAGDPRALGRALTVVENVDELIETVDNFMD